jgi:hypothetical protein
MTLRMTSARRVIEKVFEPKTARLMDVSIAQASNSLCAASHKLGDFCGFLGMGENAAKAQAGRA